MFLKNTAWCARNLRLQQIERLLPCVNWISGTMHTHLNMISLGNSKHSFLSLTNSSISSFGPLISTLLAWISLTNTLILTELRFSFGCIYCLGNCNIYILKLCISLSSTIKNFGRYSSSKIACPHSFDIPVTYIHTIWFHLYDTPYCLSNIIRF